ncbi:hypothetical protein KBZ18_14325 [Synechococcus sp. Cruz-9H2]|uniref:putative sensor domain DACNV-containing protein n=1 Tax=unclassified Synechococcus TaxID=2626047 RepID=UPI0020CE7461|nr:MULTISPECIES: hypothetical protein [unclassified Synechococcus]MCP9820660.1 hypothetical protein [Synechococcus sp. Cruz-9H2]MCP9844954.1 hypothetical protein [Synechococcus sp. Edmonson 11F2]MCP9857075.1 hypothetical protein [Synechococcus sp. Cruz-9C9]MCP9864302.1 hypothetical protein [Synechococcus sp. Cruz-7E5]MCP9871570.1 hypothetical protein [Synechococcus sp. Cruz-7B9]
MIQSMEKLDPVSVLNDERVATLLNDSSYSARRELLKEVLRISFIAGLHLNEGRQLRFAIAIEDSVLKTTRVDRFDPPIPLEARYLQSLSPALSENVDCFIVEEGARHGNTLMIVGTAALPQAQLLPSSMYLRPLVVSVNGPGRIYLEIGDVKIAYDRGDWTDCSRSRVESLWKEIAPAFVGKVSTPCNFSNGLTYGLYGHPSLDVNSWESYKSDYANYAQEYCPTLLGGVIEVIVREIQRADHGGAFMLLPSPVRSDNNLFQERRWYSGIRQELSEAIHKSLALNTIYILASQGKWIYPEGVLPTQPDDLRYWVDRIVYPQLTNSFIDLRSQCQRIAHLANADGAVVLNTMFGLEAFSAKLKCETNNLPAELALFLGSRGNRHNSMARAIATVPSSIGVVVSQDGNAVCFHNSPENDVEFFELIL